MLFLFLLSVLVQPFVPEESRADYTIRVADSSVHVTIKTVFEQNASTVRYPTYSLVLEGSNATEAAVRFTEALATIVPGVTVRDFRMEAFSSPNSNYTLSTTEMTTEFYVDGATSRENSLIKVDLAWKSFKVRRDIAAGNVSLNMIGRYLIESGLYNSTDNPPLFIAAYYLDDIAIPRSSVLDETSFFALFDMSRISKPIELWSQAVGFRSGLVITWTNQLEHTLKVINTFSEPTGPFSVTFFAGYTHSVEISAPPGASIQGDTMVIDSDAGSGTAGIMTAIIGGTLGLGLISVLYERRIRGRQRVAARRQMKKNKNRF